MLFFHFYFLNRDFPFTFISPPLQVGNLVDNIHLEGTVSQIFHLGLSYHFILKNGKLFGIICKLIF